MENFKQVCCDLACRQCMLSKFLCVERVDDEVITFQGISLFDDCSDEGARKAAESANLELLQVPSGIRRKLNPTKRSKSCTPWCNYKKNSFLFF